LFFFFFLGEDAPPVGVADSAWLTVSAVEVPVRELE
jgi:hypothetical protein